MLRIRSEVSRPVIIFLGLIPFVAIAAFYFTASAARLRENPRDKLMPGLKQLKAGWNDVWRLRVGTYEIVTVQSGDTLDSIARSKSGDADFASEIRSLDGALPDDYKPVPGDQIRVPRTERRFIIDTLASLKRLGTGVGLALVVSISFGLLMGAFTPMHALFNPLVVGLSKIPPLAILPIIFIFQGAGEGAKITIIALGIAPTLILDIYLRVREVPGELLTKAYTLGASTPEVLFRVITPWVWPAMLNSLRLALGPAWVYLIASEAIAAESGLGYRIFVVQRQLGMNIILIYVAWIMTLGMLLDTLISTFIKWRYKWAMES